MQECCCILKWGVKFDQRAAVSKTGSSCSISAMIWTFIAAHSVCAVMWLEVFPAHADDFAVRVEFFGDLIDSVSRFDPLTGKRIEALHKYTFFPKSHFVTPAQSIA